MIDVYITKGDIITARWYEADNSSLAGVQMKTGLREIVVRGVLRHIHADHPTRHTACRLFVEADDGLWCERCGCYERMVDPKHVIDAEKA